MRTIVDFTCERQPAESDFPLADDPRLDPLYNQLIAEGIMDNAGNMLKPARLRRGIGPDGWRYQVEVFELTQGTK